MTLRTLFHATGKPLTLLLLVFALAACGGTSSTTSDNNNSANLDSDEDGVSNRADLCAGTPAGSEVDADGCAQTQLDDDGDGIANAGDSCPATPTGESVNDDGCSDSQLDDDADGVSNDADSCPATETGASVDLHGCSNTQKGDDDGDGVANDSDLCPLTPSGAIIDENGCAEAQRDDDSDGVRNGQDQCPATPSEETADVQGCSASQLDDDNDGVSNADDNCANTDEADSVDSNGCSNAQNGDNDGDGVANDSDLCPNSPAGSVVEADGCPPATITDGISYNVNLSSDVDGANIAFTLHQPTQLSSKKTYPLILHSHGYSGSRQASRPSGGLLKSLLDSGFYVLSLDERGHGESGGTIRILDPDLEGKDWLQVLDWAEENLSQLAYADNGPTPATEMNNPLIGAVGGSYGGGFQHLIYAIDDKHRLDAIAPDITWHDLRYSLYSGNVFKTFWAGVLSAGGNLAGEQDDEVNEGLKTGLTENTLAEDKLALLYRHSLASHCNNQNDTTADGSLRPIDAFLTQSHMDTLFNFNDAYYNFNCLKELGGDVRLFTKAKGHGINSGDGQSVCGRLDANTVTVNWYREKLKFEDGAADEIPKVCLNLGSTGADGIALSEVPYGGTTIAISSPLQPIIAHEANQVPTVIPLYTALDNGEVIAGVPTISLSMTAYEEQPEQSISEPILFVGLGIIPTANEAHIASPPPPPFLPLMNQVTPFRGFGEYQRDLVGVMNRLQAGDQLAQLVYGSYPSQYPT
uniref:CocE/NonD family hydrolase n=1 Tax=Spongiibacter sp. TaxID=2024860 RepID=UPI0035693D81